MTIDFEFEIGEKVWDDLTGKEATIIGISFHDGITEGNKLINSARTTGYWLDNDYFDGGRHPWELTKLNESPLR